jgi:hypothetical protein
VTDIDSTHKGIVAVVSIVGCALFAYLLFSLFGPEDKANAENTVTPVAETSDTIIPDYIEAVHQQTNACDELVVTAHALEATAERCMETLRECTSMLQENHLIPKRAEKEIP